MGDIIEVDFHGGADMITATRRHRDGESVSMPFPLAQYREMDGEKLEEELEDMQNDLDDTVDAIEEFEDKFGDPASYEGEVLDEYEQLLDERFAVEFYIREVMKLLR